MADEDDPTVEDFDPEEIEIEAMEAYHVGGTRFTASFELSQEEEEVSRSVLLDVDFGLSLGFQSLLQVEDTLMSHTSLDAEHHLALELGGIVHSIDGEKRDRTELENGFLRRIWQLDADTVFAVGEDGVSYRRDQGRWHELAEFDGGDFVDVHGSGRDVVHACGPIGTLARLDGDSWIDLEIPVQKDLNAILTSSSEGLFVAGSNGTCFQILDSELIEIDAEENDFFGVREFKGRRYWSSANFGLFVQEGSRLVPFRNLGQAFSLHASKELLVITGWKEVYTFDGETFRGFRLGWDGKIFLEAIDMETWPES